MGLTEQLFGSATEKFTECVEIKIAELNEKHKNFLSEQNIDLNGSYIITFGQSGTGRIGFNRTSDFQMRLINFYMIVRKSILINCSISLEFVHLCVPGNGMI